MKKVSKDSANSYSQLKWKHACDEHARCMSTIQRFPNSLLSKRARERIEKLENEYPVLKK